ncbi:MAG: hypothetical protein NZ533_03375 [Casimicrobiaceae bacterium]|nr:hypothetical protein [Casimicrobiaceae bacterium]
MSLSNSQIDQLGERLRRCGALDQISPTDLDLLEQWRQEHEELRPWLDQVLAAYDPDILSRTSRLKRIEAIFEKLQR